MGTLQEPAAFLFGKTRAAILTLLYLNPSESFHVRELMRRVPAAPSNVQRELKALAAAGLISSSKSGNQLHYRVNRQSPLFKEMQVIISKTAGVTVSIRESLRPLMERVKIAFLFGSHARGTQIKSSDIDLMVIGDLPFRALTSALFETQKKVGREINISLLTLQELNAKVREKDPFITEVLREPKVFLIGGADDLTTMA